ncbi:hypothetical protein [Nitrosopumilus sp. S6]
MHVETIQTEELSQLDKLVNEVIEQRKVVDIKLNTAVFREKILYTALIILDD